ncbi:hypothetical protein HPP92_001773 [Vanilla planifolia]|uniref:Dirigent protein n=1 Tax=Vanilla planifolia TaxID=51239 RepID=A0A835S404_VANPL|nr:hypothetical protein HPP92_001773 [Vanilla planifolia]
MAAPTQISFFALLVLLIPAARSSAEGFPKDPEQRSHIHFFIHDKISGPNATAIKVGTNPNPPRSETGLDFASVFVVDDLMTVGPDPSSRAVGRARGFYTVSSLSGSDLYFSVHAVFTDGIYKGGTLAVVARDAILEPIRELPIVGGTGVFRLARGFAFMKTHAFDTKTGNAVLEVDAYVLHH